jgi:hypothetical protein
MGHLHQGGELLVLQLNYCLLLQQRPGLHLDLIL